MEQLLTIGEFAERCGLSRSALRFYDQTGLLRPRMVDEATGYRRYAVAQLLQAWLVRQLREAEMPVGLLREFLTAAPEQRGAILDEHLASFRQRMSDVEDAVDELRRGLEVSHGGAARSCSVAPAEFAAALGQVSFAIAESDARSELAVVWIETKDDSLRLVATDSYRIAVRDLVPERIGPQWLRGAIAAEQAQAMTAELGTAGTLVLSQDCEGVISATVDGHRTTVGNAGAGFPDYERILTGIPAGHRIALARDAVTAALAGLPATVTELLLEFETERLVLRAREYRAAIAGAWSGPSLRILLSSRFFVEAVSATVGPDLVIEAFDPLRPITLRSADTGTFSVLTMPIGPPGAA